MKPQRLPRQYELSPWGEEQAACEYDSDEAGRDRNQQVGDQHRPHDEANDGEQVRDDEIEKPRGSHLRHPTRRRTSSGTIAPRSPGQWIGRRRCDPDQGVAIAVVEQIGAAADLDDGILLVRPGIGCADADADTELQRSERPLQEGAGADRALTRNQLELARVGFGDSHRQRHLRARDREHLDTVFVAGSQSQ